jgi:hypothetical protein
MANELYDGKLFYEVIVDTDRKKVFLSGPLDNIRHVSRDTSEWRKGSCVPVKFVQLFNGNIVHGFTEDEIMVLDA